MLNVQAPLLVVANPYVRIYHIYGWQSQRRQRYSLIHEKWVGEVIGEGGSERCRGIAGENRPRVMLHVVIVDAPAPANHRITPKGLPSETEAGSKKVMLAIDQRFPLPCSEQL